MAKGKRQAGTDLNHDNWNEEEEAEDAGEFKKASDDILQQRVRKIAKRRVAGVDEGKPASNPFSSFGGFGGSSLSSSTTSNSSPFGFLSKLPSSTTSASTATEAAPLKTNGALKTTDENADYLSKVKALNESFIKWIKQNVDEDALCDLRTVFKDYEKYITEFENLKGKPTSVADPPKKDPLPATTSTTSSSPSNSFVFGKPMTSPPAATTTTGISFNSSPAKPPSPLKPTESNFSFGLTASNTQIGSTPFSFGIQKTSTTLSSGPAAAPLFGNITASSTSTPFSFGNVTQNKETDGGAGGGEEEESEEPPKNEFKPVVEEDSLYSKRCKVFVKTGSDYSDRGVGTVFLKKVEDKLQMIVRADTNLGNILLNIIISEGLPCSRMGKNNVMIVCVPTPESKPPPVPVLVRVKTGEEADDLLATIEKYKKE